jgi:hypothetical protein
MSDILHSPNIGHGVGPLLAYPPGCPNFSKTLCLQVVNQQQQTESFICRKRFGQGRFWVACRRDRRGIAGY